MSTISLTNLERALGQSKGKGGQSTEPGSGPQLCGDIDMRIARDGTWYYMGSPIGRKPLVKLFASVLNRTETGEYWLITPAEMCRIRVDDAPFCAVEMTVSGSGPEQCLSFRTNIDEIVTAGADHPIRVTTNMETGEPSPYVMIRDGLEALISRPVFYQLVETGGEDPSAAGAFGVWSAGVFFELGRLDDA